MINIDTHRLGETEQFIETEVEADLQQLILAMSRQAGHRILIFSHTLEHSLFDSDELYEAIKTLAIASHRTHIHILVQDARPMTRKGHRLLRLARRISSHIKIKVSAEEHQAILENFIIFDDRGYIVQNNPERFEGYGNFNDPQKAHQLEEDFIDYWERGHIDISLRQLSL